MAYTRHTKHKFEYSQLSLDSMVNYEDGKRAVFEIPDMSQNPLEILLKLEIIENVQLENYES